MTTPATALPTISRTYDEATDDLVWTLRIPRAITTDFRSYERVRTRMAAWALRLVAQAIEELPK